LPPDNVETKSFVAVIKSFVAKTKKKFAGPFIKYDIMGNKIFLAKRQKMCTLKPGV